MDNLEIVELLFFDTFAHENTEEINLDLVQFPKPAYVTEVRIIPLGARVQADFPGGVRLGATNPSQFKIEFFVNDLSKPGASTFETLGGFEYNQNGCINLDCIPNDIIRKIPTDGLVLKGWYTTITLAVYGTLTKNITEQIIQPVVVNPVLPTQSNPPPDPTQIIASSTLESEWSENIQVPVEYNQPSQVAYQQAYPQTETFSQEYQEYYNDVPKDPRNYHHTPETADWDNKARRTTDVDRERDRDRGRDLTYQKTGSLEREHGRSDVERRDRDKVYRRSQSRDRDRSSRDYRELSHAEHERDWTDRNERERPRERERDRDRPYKHDDNYRRAYGRDDRDREERKRPRTPPLMSPKRPRTPHELVELTCPLETEPPVEEETVLEQQPRKKDVVESEKKMLKEVKEVNTSLAEEPNQQIDVEEFEPILSDEDILDDNEQYQDIDYDYSGCTNNDDLIKSFIPGTTELIQHQKEPMFSICENNINIGENFRTIIGIVDDYFKSSITRYVLSDFDKLNTEIKEEFIHLCEKLIPTIESIGNFIEIMKLYTAIKVLKIESLNPDSIEIVNQVTNIVCTLMDWSKIALNYQMANIQEKPAYKIRHIKCGVRLADWCCNSDEFIRLMASDHFVLHDALLYLYTQEFMALSIKLMILKALDTYLLHKFAVEHFLRGEQQEKFHENGYGNTLSWSQNNGYTTLLDLIRKNPLVRLKFALNSILKKISLYEVLHKMHFILNKLRNTQLDNILAEDINLITKILDQILQNCHGGDFVFSQPKRFLPVSCQFEIGRTETRKNILITYFKMFDILQCFLLLLTCPSTLNLPAIKTPIFEILDELLGSPEGLEYLSLNCETVNVLVKCFLQSDDEVPYSIQNYLYVKSHNLGLNIANKLQTYFYIESLSDLGKRYNYDCSAGEVIDSLQALFSLSFSPIGKLAIAEVVGIKPHFKTILQFLNVRDKSESHLAKIKKSPGVAYIIDLIYFIIVNTSNVPLLESYSKDILHIINYQDIFEDSSLSKLNEIRAYVTPFDNGSYSYENINPLLETIIKDIDNITQFPGQVITCLRVLEHLGISKYSKKYLVLSENPLSNYTELKYKHVILQLYSLDGTSLMTKILQKLCEYYDQPSLYTSNFVSHQGLLLVNIVSSCILLLKHMLTYVIHCRNTNFKDLTSIPILLQTYGLLKSFPTSSPYFETAQQICENIVSTLLVYTQPVSDEIHEKDSLNKTLWSQMCGEVIKYVIYSPYTFIPGLQVFSELLPLPLPVQTTDQLSPEEVSWTINLRKLWSAHLHPYNSNIQDMIIKLCTTAHQQLVNLLRRVCVQISDLAANSAVMVARGILDEIHEAINRQDDTKLETGLTYLGRLLNFLACLLTHSALKSAVLYLINANTNGTFKGDEKYATLIQSFAQLLKLNTSQTRNSFAQIQECILCIFQSLCDSEITVYQNASIEIDETSSNLYLANALPTKDQLTTFISMIIEHILGENVLVTYLPAVRTLLLLIEHNYGFYHLREQLLKKPGIFVTLLDKLTKNFSKSNGVCVTILSTLVEFIRVSVVPEDEEEDEQSVHLPRTLKLSLAEFKEVVKWIDGENNDEHPLCSLEESLKKIVEEDTNFESLLENVSGILKLLKCDQVLDINTDPPVLEPNLPHPETLLFQFSNRTVYSSTDVCDERLTATYWLSAPNEETDAELDNISSDLTEICRLDLSTEYNLVREVESVCRICPSDTVTEKAKRVENQKTKMKKPYITPMRTRGFPRSVQQRPDLFRSRPPNTSRPPSLHVDDFVALETCGAQPTGPTGYNKISRELLACSRNTRGTRGRAFIASERAVQYRQMSWWGAGMGRGPY